ncbi:hypothetical protein Bca4012_100970 [Brassica carinata]|uniref:procollagen-proline 3-dioxygenase n=2 Tax=Brassica TaxID=3705 RepID=A0A8X7PMC8_BRACI|nr:hypothetical protein Bca52824_083468 [Brassica carinata]VDD63440.1 unnamed protein product [Brassica oleracea]
MWEGKREHPRLILHNFITPEECKELEFIHRSCSTVGYRPNVFSTTLSHLIATNSPHLLIPFVSIRERLKEKMEETFGCEYELFIEFTGLISWCRGASIGWHSDDNRQYLKQRDFSAVCYLNSYGKDFKGGLFRFQSGEPATIAPSAGDVIMYTADDRNIHSVDEVTDGERLTLAMWFTRDSSHDEDSNLISRLSQCASPEFPLPLPASANMYWFCPHQHANLNTGFDICVARLHLLGFDVHSLQEEDRSLDASEQLMGLVQLAKGGELLARKFTNVLHALQVVQFCHWKASELKTSKVEYEEEVKAMSQPQLETINALNAVFLPDKGLVTTTFGYLYSNGEEKDSLNLTNVSSAIASWEEYTCKLLKELLSSLPQWETYQTIHKVESG